MIKEIYYAEIDDCGTFVAAQSEEEAREKAMNQAKTNRESFFAIKLNGQTPKSERFGSGLPFTTHLKHIQKARISGYEIKLEELVDGEETQIDKQLWYAEVKNRQIFTLISDSPGATRDFDYVIFMAAENEIDARKQTEKRLFRTPDEFFTDYYNENCPPPQYFDLECSITYMRRVSIPGYKIRLEEIIRK